MINFEELDPETKQKLLGKNQKGDRVKVDKDAKVKAASDVLAALTKTGLPVSVWASILRLVERMIKMR